MLVLQTLVKAAKNSRAINEVFFIRCYYRVSTWCLWDDTHAMVCIWRQEDRFVELVLSIHLHEDSNPQTTSTHCTIP